MSTARIKFVPPTPAPKPVVNEDKPVTITMETTLGDLRKIEKAIGATTAADLYAPYTAFKAARVYAETQ